ncbi:hypothetical protein T4B_6932 [Trichinella pseudospiralis]|uniref:Uncharacterized protein n=1 Tax=Trichinella pseudospiralis TaxID=6337 RepID=A0A0V1GG55_TRIPS|nr:hypothetical protein T4B_6932 [Trichinella pseudospiralis]
MVAVTPGSPQPLLYTIQPRNQVTPELSVVIKFYSCKPGRQSGTQWPERIRLDENLGF